MAIAQQGGFLMAVEAERRESRIRKLATRRGYYVRKDRARSYSFNHQGLFRLMNPSINCIVMGERFDVSLEDIENFLNGTD